MSIQDRYNLLLDRYNKLINNPKNLKNPGVCHKVLRQLRNLKNQLGENLKNI